MNPLIDAFERDVRTIQADQFEVYQNGWEGQLGMALVDAVYSKQMLYKTKRGKGLLPRLRAFKEKYPQAGVDLRELLELSEADLQDILSHGVTNGRTKASAVLEAARSLVQLGVYTHEQYDHHNQAQRNAYLHVHGLGTVTHNYFGMLLGYPDTKPDTWIIRAVQRVADAESLDVSVDSKLARTVVTQVHQRTNLGKTVTHMDHAIWLTERERA
ncbi:hypothetical protein [Arthrobacter sp. N199823]|uniref:hypothetical protein n=1 Tax=Arthrobacter sp. N199823 TaxID=2058895 RepID=UPI000CE51664|nr:hypothetical protein [Arthrobacter sp. N199823]